MKNNRNNNFINTVEDNELSKEEKVACRTVDTAFLLILGIISISLMCYGLYEIIQHPQIANGNVFVGLISWAFLMVIIIGGIMLGLKSIDEEFRK